LGHASPLTGPQAHIGKDNENGARLAVEDANAAKIKIGDRAVAFELMGGCMRLRTTFRWTGTSSTRLRLLSTELW
jgi:hypothetical protein